MRDRRLTRLFTRFQLRGDVEALTSIFNATAPVLLSLARHLVGRPEEAEDVVQATFLTAIEQAARFDASQALEPWLTGILVRKARQSNARAARAVEPDRMPEHASSDPAQGASRSELAAELTRALSELPEAYAHVLRPFLQDGDLPRDIALREGSSPGSIRVRIHRGLKLLRKALPAGYAASAGASGVSGVLGVDLGSMRSTIEQAAHAAGPALAKTGSSAVLAWSGSRTCAVFATVALVGAGVWRLARPSFSTANETAVAASLTRPREEAELAPLVAPPESILIASEEPAGSGRALGTSPDSTTEPNAPSWTLVLNVTGFSGGPSGKVHLKGKESGEGTPFLDVHLTEDGTIRLDLRRAGFDPPALELELTNDYYASFHYVTSSVDVTHRGELVVDVPLERRFRVIAGRVVSANEAAPLVAFYPEPAQDQHMSIGRVLGACDDNGFFRFHVLGDRSGWLAAAADGCAPAGEYMLFYDYEDIDLGLIELDEGASIDGVAYDPGRVPATSGTLAVSHAGLGEAPTASLGNTSIGFLETGVVSAGARIATDAEGAFRVGGLTPGLYDVLFVSSTGASGTYDTGQDGLRVRAPISNLELESPIRVYTLSVMAEGLPVVDATVRYNLTNGSVAGPTTRDGSYAFFMAQTSLQKRVEFEKPGFASRELMIGPRDFDRDGFFEVELERTAPASALTLELTVERGPIGSFGLRLSLLDSSWYAYRSGLTTSGTLEFGEVPAGRYSLQLWPEMNTALEPSQHGHWLKTEVNLACEASVSERIPIPLLQGGRVAFHVTNQPDAGPGVWSLGGEHAPDRLWLMSYDPLLRETDVLYTSLDIDEDGEYWLHDALRPGEYILSIGRDDVEEQSYSFLVSPGGVADVFVGF